MNQVPGGHDWQKKAVERQKEFRQMLAKLKPAPTYKLLPKLHDEAFEKIDCLACGNCCKGYSPRFNTTDIKRIAKYLKRKESVLIDEFLLLDADGDYVMKKQPCAFLGADNYCSIYEVRPRDCERFPYTHEDVLLKRPGITLKNATFCPAVYDVLDKLSAQKL